MHFRVRQSDDTTGDGLMQKPARWDHPTGQGRYKTGKEKRCTAKAPDEHDRGKSQLGLPI